MCFHGKKYWADHWNRKLQELIDSSKYKSSRYEVHIINNEYYALYNKHSQRYVGLKYYGFEWPLGHQYEKDCLGTIGQVISRFKEVCPDVVIVESVKVL